MRQLDLFGFFVDTPPQENKPADKPRVTKPEEGSMVADTETPSYSKNTLRSERLVTDTAANPLEPTIEKQAQEVPKNTPLPSPSALLLSLFDAPVIAEDAETVVQPVDEIVSENHIAAGALAEQIEPINETEIFETSSATEAEVIVVAEPSDVSVPPPLSEPVAEVKKRVAVPRLKKPELPELRRNGSVIFDDGKITVKIKSTSPFPAPIVKEKKEKIKKPPQKRGRKSFKEIDAEVDLIEIPEDEILFQKQYYPISEVAKWFRVNTSLLRFWENEFDVLKPRKNRKGDRLFRPEDVKNLQLIYQLLRQRKYTIEGAKEYIKTNKKKADIQLHLTNTLQKFKSFLLDLKANLQP